MSFTRNLCNKYGKQFLDTDTKTELDALKTASRKCFIKYPNQQMNLQETKYRKLFFLEKSRACQNILRKVCSETQEIADLTKISTALFLTSMQISLKKN